jgi:hypothetical protein
MINNAKDIEDLRIPPLQPTGVFKGELQKDNGVSI